jgi:hypothetical protein
LAAVNDDPRGDPRRSEEPAPDIFGMELFVFPDPHQGLPDHGARVLVDVKSGHPPDDSLFPIGNGHDLFALQAQEDQPPALQFRAAGKLGPPPVEQPSDVIEEGGLQILRTVLRHGTKGAAPVDHGA